MDDPRQSPDESMDLARLGAVWRGEIDDAYGEAAIVGTLAMALKALGAAETIAAAEANARALWLARDRMSLAAAA